MNSPTSQRKRIKFALPGSQNDTWVRIPPIQYRVNERHFSISSDTKLFMRVASPGLAIAQESLGQVFRWDLLHTRLSFDLSEVILSAAYNAD
jgi:hypothetical protein